jgi:hypothetical protein
VIYTLPDGGLVRDFVAGRVDPLIDNSPYLSELAGRWRGSKVQGRRIADNRGLKRLGDGMVYFRGTRSVQGALSVPAHALIHDELDYSQPKVLQMFSHRLDALPPEERSILQFSTPTVAGYGISAIYEASDAREWLVRCTSCNWCGPLDYFDHTRGELTYLQCTKCGGKLDPRNGAWVPKYPGRDVHGYWVPRLLMAVPERPDLLEALHKRRAEARYAYIFHNMGLGIPSEEGASRITRQQILSACFTEAYPPSLSAEWGTGPYFMGVDQGDVLTVIIARADPRRDGGRLRVVHLERLRDPSGGSGAWAQVAGLIERFKVKLCVVDVNPNRSIAHVLAKQFPGRVLLCYYTTSQLTEIRDAPSVRKRAESPGWPLQAVGPTDRVDISVGRTDSLDRAASALVSGRISLPGPSMDKDIEEFMQHCGNNVRRPEEGADGVIVYRWWPTGQNDYLHALNYLLIAAEEGAHLATLNPRIMAPVGVWGVPQRYRR